MKDGRTHLAHKAEHGVDLESGAVVAVTIQPADKGDTETVKETLITAAENIEKVNPDSLRFRSWSRIRAITVTSCLRI